MVKYFNRKTNKYELEQVVGEKYLQWSYSSPVGMEFWELLIKKKIFSKVYGCFCDSKRSIKKIRPFINNFNIDMSICEKN